MKIADEIAQTFNKLITAEPKTYQVQPQDTLYGISNRLKIEMEDLKKLNPNVNWDQLPIGTELKLPTGETSKEMSLEEFEGLINRTATEQQVPPMLLRGLVAAESSGDPKAAANSKSPLEGAVGLTQLTPFARKSLGIADPYDLKKSLEGGAKWLRTNYEKYTQDIAEDEEDRWDLALMMYHAGPTAVRKWVRAGRPNKLGNVGPLTIKYPATVRSRGGDLEFFKQTETWRK